MMEDEIVGKNVYNLEGKEVGEVKDLVISKADNQGYMVIGVGGLLGLGEKEVAVSFDQVEIQEDGMIRLLSVRTEDDLENMAKYNKDAYCPLNSKRFLVM